MRIYTHEQYLEHQVPDGHPERPERLRTLLAHFDACGITQDAQMHVPPTATARDIRRVHPPSHLSFLEQTQPNDGQAPVDPDTWMSSGSMQAALYAAGALCDATQSVLAGDTQRAFCAVRPPGHHAETSGAMGFCLLNNIAIGAMLALETENIERIAILDFDVHHGNGTVDVFKDDPRVLVCSSFQSPFYPNRLDDLVRDHIVNTPLAAHTDGNHFRRAVEAQWLPAIEAHKPQLIFVSAGFDAHTRDPLANLDWVEDDFAWVTQQIVGLANSHAEGRVIAALEGGYDLAALASSAEAHIGALLD